jgi:hypothetical protein
MDKNLGVQELVNIPSSFIHEKYLRSLLWVKGGESRGIWVNVNNPSSPTSSIHEDILIHTLNTLKQEIVRKSKKSTLVGETILYILTFTVTQLSTYGHTIEVNT